MNPCHTWATIARPTSAMTSPSHTMRGVRCFRPKWNHSATMIGAVNSMRRAMPTGSSSMATKYRYCVMATPSTPYASRIQNSERRIRRVAGRVRATTTSRMRNAAVTRSCDSRAGSIPLMRMDLLIVPFSANRAAAVR